MWTIKLQRISISNLTIYLKSLLEIQRIRESLDEIVRERRSQLLWILKSQFDESSSKRPTCINHFYKPYCYGRKLVRFLYQHVRRFTFNI